MFRRCLSLLIITGFLANQMALVPHAHGIVSSKEQQKHDATPHFHCGPFCHHSQEHNHAHGGHGHSHAAQQVAETDLTVASDEAGQLAVIEENNSNHDLDAVFVPGISVTATSFKIQLDSVWQCSWRTSLPCHLSESPGISGRALHWQTPENVLDASDSFLILRHLRI